MTELVIAVTAAVGISAICSLFEAVLYSAPIGHIETMAESGSASGRILRSLRENVDRPIAAILSLNTIANTAGAAVAGAAAATVFGHEALGYFSAFFTLVILMFSEVIPKTVGVVYSRGLAGPIARPLLALVFLFRPLIWLTGQVTHLIARVPGHSEVSEEEILVMARLGLKSGSIEVNEAAVIENVLGLEEQPISEIMTPRTVVFSLSVNLTIRELRESTKPLNHSRVPVYDRDSDDVVGMILRRDVLMAMAEDRWDHTLERYMRPVDFVAETMTADRLLRRLLESRQHLAMVIDEFGGLAGLVTLEDVLEEILGTEIVDEFDQAIDMRELAHRRREESTGQPGTQPG